LAGVPDDRIEAMAAAARTHLLAAGAVLYQQGDPATDLAVVVSGRLRATSTRSGSPVVDREIGRGEPVGEIGFLTGEPRSATVSAVRTSVVLRLGRAAVDEALRAAPEVSRTLMALVADRLRHPVLASATPSSIGLLPWRRGGPDVADGAEEVVGGLERGGMTALVPGRGGVTDPETAEGLRELIDRAEAAGDLVVVPLDDRRPGWDDLAARQVDRLLVWAGTGGAPPPGPETSSLLGDLESDGVTPRRELVLIHAASGPDPRGVPAWMDATAVARVHHLRSGNAGDVDRLARHLTGRSLGLVLSGGGARAMAHLGAYRAIAEAGVPIDHVGGSSIGGVVAAQIASGASPEELIELDRREFRSAAFGRRFTLPLISLHSIRRAVSLFEHLFGDRDLSDAWIPSFVTVVDFTDCVLVIRDRGPAALWARATASPPGLWPPVVDDRGHLFVDGGVVDNLPVTAMRAEGAGLTIAVNVTGRRDLRVAGADREIPTWPQFAYRTITGRAAPSYPSIVPTIMRLGLLASLGAQVDAIEQTDLYVDPPVADIGMTNYRRFDDAVDAGYRSTVDALESGTISLP